MIVCVNQRGAKRDNTEGVEFSVEDWCREGAEAGLEAAARGKK
jgi:hypothetical protein